MQDAVIVPNPPDPIDPVAAAAAEEINSFLKHPNWYFDGSLWFFKVLRFLNALEPDRTVLSLTKIMMWGATVQSMLVISTSSDWLTVAGALGLNVATMVKHENRRKVDGVGD